MEGVRSNRFQSKFIEGINFFPMVDELRRKRRGWDEWAIWWVDQTPSETKRCGCLSSMSLLVMHHTGALRYPSSPSRGSLPLPPHYSLNIYMARSTFVRNLAMTLVSSPMSPTISPLWSPWLWLVAWPTPHLAIDDLPLYPVHHQRIFPIQTRTTSIDPNWGIERVMPQHGGTIAKEIK